MTVQPRTALDPVAEHPSRVQHPEWSRSAAIYQVNTRQFTPEGTFAAAQEQLPRLRDLGVSIVWLMPVHPIGEHERKGELGSPYAVRDHLAVNPDLGTVDDLRRFVDAAHDLGLHVILDWVANHTAWDNPLLEQHPEWYLRDEEGELASTPWWDWPDIVELDFRVPELRSYMIDALTYWVREVGVDGYRCDVAGFVPTAFWEQARAALEQVKPVFLLAEWEARDLHDLAFDASYGWSWYTALQRIVAGQADTGALREFYVTHQKTYPADAYRMTFVSNHDKNAWEGTEFEIFGDAVEAAVVLSCLGEGIPLVYNGQEAGNDRRLSFFERDPIDWREHEMGDLYRRLLAEKRRNPNLANGAAGARMVEVRTDQPDTVFAFTRGRGAGAVLVVLNLSPEPTTVTLRLGSRAGRYVPVLGGDPQTFGDGSSVELAPWGFVAAVRSDG